MIKHKGIDDLLAAGRKPRRLVAGEVPAFFAKIRAHMFAAPLQTKSPDVSAAATIERPIFPVAVFPAKVATFANRVAAAMRCPIDFVGLATLVISGAAIGVARAIEVKAGWRERPGLYAVIVSRPGTTKTPALKAVMQPIYQEQDRLYEQHKAALKQYEVEAHVHKKAQQKLKDDEPEPVPPAEPLPLRHLFANDTTVESLAANLAENRKGLLLFRDELTAWVRSLDMYKGRGTDRQFFLSAWSGEMVKVDRKGAHGKPIIIPYPFIGVLGGIQPDLLTELEAEGGKEDGFIHRILFSFPAESPAADWTDDEISEDDEQEWRLVLNQLLNLQLELPPGGSERPKCLQFSPDGRQAFVKWFDALTAEMRGADFQPELLGPWNKLRAHCARFALIIHMLRVVCQEAGTEQDEGLVDAEDVHRATQLCAYFQAHLKLVYPRLRQSQMDKQVDELIAWMKKKHLPRVTPRDVCRANVCGIKKASEAEQLLKEAADRGLGTAEGDPSRLARRQGPEVRAFNLNGS